MKGKTIAIGVLVITIVAVAAIYFLVMATFKHDERTKDTSMEWQLPIEVMDQTFIS